MTVLQKQNNSNFGELNISDKAKSTEYKVYVLWLLPKNSQVVTKIYPISFKKHSDVVIQNKSPIIHIISSIVRSYKIYFQITNQSNYSMELIMNNVIWKSPILF